MYELTTSTVPGLAAFPKVKLGHTPTPLEFLPRLSNEYASHRFYVKRDDCTGLGLGGNKVRQLEYYLGDAISKGCDTVLSTGAVQSNYMRTLAAAAGKLGLKCHIQLEDRVPNKSELYYRTGNRMLTELFGAMIIHCPHDLDEEGADRNLRKLAEDLASQGCNPYVVPLKPVKQPRGALGYVDAASELISQCQEQGLKPDLAVVGSGSGITHAGLLFGLRLLNCDLPVMGACVRRSAALQGPRILSHCRNLCGMTGMDDLVNQHDVWVTDNTLAPGYGQVTKQIRQAVETAATLEGLLLDPIYTGKVLASLLKKIENKELCEYKTIIFIHTGGAPALFAYPDFMNT